MKNVTRFLALILVGCASVLFAQTDTAVLFGLVKDTSGGSIVGAKVVVRNLGTGVQRELETDAKGLYYFTLLPPGAYEITAESASFKSYRNSAVTVQVAQVARLDIELPVGSTSEHIEVSNNASVLNTENATQGTVISQEKIPSLPLNGRQFLQLALPGSS